jgi:hypothetical protein
MESALHVAKTLHTNAEKAFLSLSELSASLLEDPSSSVTSPAASPTRRMKSIGKGLIETHTTYLKTAESALEQARQEYRRAEEESDANGSLFHYIDDSLTARVELRFRVEENIRRMKDMLSPRRRVPNELWCMIFRERVTEDEDEHEETFRRQMPPFTTLKLTWVCRLWRQIISEQPSLWQYIALPRTLYLSPSQADRVKYFQRHLKKHPPKLYMMRGSRGAGRDIVPLQPLWSMFSSVNRFEAQLRPESRSVQIFLNSVEVPIKDLILTSSPNGEEQDSDILLSYNAIKSVESLMCYGVRPCVDSSRSDEEQAQLNSLLLRLHEVDNTELILFLEISGASTLIIVPWNEWSVDEADGVEQDIELTRLNAIEAPLAVLKYAFNQHVLLSGLCTLRIDLDSTRTIGQALYLWTSFLSIHERRDTVTTLDIWGLPEERSSADMSAMLSQLINQTPNVENLVLRDTAAVPSLQGLASSKKIPSGIITVEISSCDDVTEDLIITFLRAFYSKKREPLSLEIFDCFSISEDAKERLNLAHDQLKKSKAKKKKSTA